MTLDDDYKSVCDSGYENCAEYRRTIGELRAQLTALLDILRDAQICEPWAGEIRKVVDGPTGANQRSGER